MDQTQIDWVGEKKGQFSPLEARGARKRAKLVTYKSIQKQEDAVYNTGMF